MSISTEDLATKLLNLLSASRITARTDGDGNARFTGPGVSLVLIAPQNIVINSQTIINE